jgi:RNA exonuclease 1
LIQQGGGSKGHSSVEDSVASLDLVKWFVLNKKTKPVIVAVGARARGAGEGGISGGQGSGSGGKAAPATKM